MDVVKLSRRSLLAGVAASLSGCGALASLNAASATLDTYDLTPIPGSTAGRRTRRTLVVARPSGPAGILTDRIMVKPTPSAITFLPEARWPDELPAVLQSLLIRSISGTGRLGYVGTAEGGPVPDLALLTRIDAFQVEIEGETLVARMAMQLTLLRDNDQRVLANRSFTTSVPSPGDTPAEIVGAFQAGLNVLLPQMADWVASV